jgi:hypothetical protein
MPGEIVHFTAPGGAAAVYAPGSAAEPVSQRVAALTRPTRAVSLFTEDGAWTGSREEWRPPPVRPGDVPDLRCQAALLDEVLAPAPRDALLKRVLVLLAHYRADPLPPDIEAAIAEDWADDLGEFPLWAVEEACRRWRRDARKGRFRPYTSDIRALCESIVEREATMRRRVDMLLDRANTPAPRADEAGSRAPDVKARVAALAASKRMP